APDGVSFTSHRADDEGQSEFLASTDNWFRPAMIRTGPDGALWIADMYRFVIEHPEWIPEDWQRKLDVRAGDDKGRIYRVVRADAPSPKIPRLDRLDTAGLVAALENSNGWVRDMAQQMLLWRNDRAAVPLLSKLAGESRSAVARLHALGTLEGIGALSADLIAAGLRDRDPGVRRFAIQLRERMPAAAVTQAVNEAFWAMAADRDPLVQMQFAYTLGSQLDKPAAPILAAKLLEHTGNPYLTAALLSSLRKDTIGEVLSAVALASDRPGRDALVEQLLTMAAAFGQHDAVRTVLGQIVAADAPKRTPSHFRAINIVLRSAARQGISLDKLADAETRRGLQQLHAEARRVAASTEKADRRWKTVAPWLLAQGLGDDAADLALLQSAMQPGQPADVQAVIIEALSASREPKVADLLLSGWSGYAPDLRARVFAAIKSRDAWVSALLDRVENGHLSATDFDARSRAELSALKNESLRRRADRLLTVTPNADRRRVVESYQPIIHMHGDSARGKEVFTKRCSQCHFYEGIGHRVGPEITSIKDRSPAALVIAILDPNRSVESRYVEYVAELSDGRTFSGIVAEETTNSITLVGPEEKRQTILRTDIESLRSAGRSLMPEGLEKDLQPLDLADIIAFVGKSEPPHEFPGNSPGVVKADSSGTIVLAATRSRIYGPRMIFEVKHQNLGWWARPEDHAEWTCETHAAGKYRVSLDYACASEAAGNEFALKIAEQEFRGKIAGTGTWDDYRQIDVGEVQLPAGQTDVVIQSAGPIRSALMDLRTIVLTPIDTNPKR
ncbi:MAG TPA: hypothetical protein VKB78_01790, partial [Pirellulales bacterium]|nr:hypothetical protein [Pirellulales bacterium]